MPPIRYSKTVKEQLEKLTAKTGGFFPFVTVVESDSELTSSLQKPTLYPQLTIPRYESGDWAEVAHHLDHLTRALDGIPELRVHGTETDQKIAQSLNNEVEWLASMYSGVVPTKKHDGYILEQIKKYVETDHTDTLFPQHIFQAFRLQNKKKYSVPQGNEALAHFTKHFPEAVKKASVIQDRIDGINPSTLSGKVEICKILIGELGFDPHNFYLQETKFSSGVYISHHIDYYDKIEEQEQFFLNQFDEPFAIIKAQLPFHLHCLQGCYKLEYGAILIKHINVNNARASWKTDGGARVESMMDSTGLYQNTSLKIILPGSFIPSSTPPRDDALYKNHKYYPEHIHKSLDLVNGLITYIRKEKGRCDIPDVTLLHFNNIHFQQFNERKEKIYDVHSTFEYVTVSSGIPKIESEVLDDVTVVKRLPFYTQLLESAKVHLLQLNLRRAILDYCGAFEAFVAEHIKVKLTTSTETVKERFLRIYKSKLSKLPKECVDSIGELVEGNDREGLLPIGKLVDNYRKEGHTPRISKSNSKKLLKPFHKRNDAAHGRQIDNFILSDLEKAIDLFDEVESTFNRYES